MPYVVTFEDTPEERATIVMEFVYSCYFQMETPSMTKEEACDRCYNGIIGDCEKQKKNNCKQIVDNGANYFCKPLTGDTRLREWCNEKNFSFAEINPTTVAPPGDTYTLTHVIGVSAACFIIASILTFLITCVLCKKKNKNGNGGVEGGTTQGTTRTGTTKTRGTTTKTGKTKTRGTTTRNGTTQL